MNRFLSIILILFIAINFACDTSSNVRPRNEDFYFKVYGGLNEGDHEAATIIETSDGGLLIAGTTYNLDQPEEILLIKTDQAGNVEWQQGYNDYLGPGLTSEAKTLLEGANGFIVGGVVDDGIVKNSILFRVDASGLPSSTDSILIRDSDFPDADYILTSVTLGPSGLLAAGTTNQELLAGFRGGQNGFFSVYNESLDGSINVLGKEIFGLEGDEEIVGAFEVDPAKIGPDGSQYLVFGTTTGNTPLGNKNFFYTGFNANFSQSPGINVGTIIDDASGSQSGSKVKSFNNDYWMIGNSDETSTYLVGWRFNGSSTDVDWQEIPNYRSINISGLNEIGKSLAFGTQGKVVLGDVLYSADHNEIVLASLGGDSNVDPGWPITFGNSSSTYSAADVIILSDGSIVTLGTADLEPIKKIVVIKTGPNGEMSFE